MSPLRLANGSTATAVCAIEDGAEIVALVAQRLGYAVASVRPDFSPGKTLVAAVREEWRAEFRAPYG